MNDFVGVRAKTRKTTTMKIKSKRHKKCVIKRKFKLEDYKNCLDEAKIENKINQLEKYNFDVDSLKEDPKEFIFIGKQTNTTNTKKI